VNHEADSFREETGWGKQKNVISVVIWKQGERNCEHTWKKNPAGKAHY